MSQTSILKYIEKSGLKTWPADPAVVAEYERSMREDCIPKIERALKEQARAAHFFRLGIPDPAR